MSTLFRNAEVLLTNAMQDVYTCPANTVAIVIGAQWQGKTDLNIGVPLWIDRTHYVGSSTINIVRPYSPVFQNAAVATASGANDNPLKSRIVLYAGDKIRAQYDVVTGAPGATLTLSILEMPTPAAFKNADLALTNTYQTMYTCPASTIAVIIGAHAKLFGDTAGQARLLLQRTDAALSLTVDLADSYSPIFQAYGSGVWIVDNPLKSRIVLNQGDAVKAALDTTGGFTISGGEFATLTLAILEVPTS